MNIIQSVQSIERDYGMQPDDWPEDDVRLKKIHDWWLDHPDKMKRTMSDRMLKEIQKMLDAKTSKKSISKIFGVSEGAIAYNIKQGKLSDKKWRA